jgi:hypothetical protein
MAELCHNYLQKEENPVLHGRIMADILGGGRIMADILGGGRIMADILGGGRIIKADLTTCSGLTVMNDDSAQAISIMQMG